MTFSKDKKSKPDPGPPPLPDSQHGEDPTSRANEGVGPQDQRFDALRTVGQHSSDVIVVLDETGNVSYANPSALDIFGICFEAGVGTSSFRYLHPDDLAQAKGRFAELLQTPGASFNDTLRTVTEGGVVRELEIVATNCLDNPIVSGIVVNGRDVTERNNLTRALQTLTQGNQVLVRATDESLLIADLCQTIVSSGA